MWLISGMTASKFCNSLLNKMQIYWVFIILVGCNCISMFMQCSPGDIPCASQLAWVTVSMSWSFQTANGFAKVLTTAKTCCTPPCEVRLTVLWLLLWYLKRLPWRGSGLIALFEITIGGLGAAKVRHSLHVWDVLMILESPYHALWQLRIKSLLAQRVCNSSNRIYWRVSSLYNLCWIS